MFAKLQPPRPDLDALQRTEAMVRARFALSDSDLILVSEEIARQPGQPEHMTVVLFWKGPERHRIAFFKPVAEVSKADLPPAWVAGALCDDGAADCC